MSKIKIISATKNSEHKKLFLEYALAIKSSKHNFKRYLLIEYREEEKEEEKKSKNVKFTENIVPVFVYTSMYQMGSVTRTHCMSIRNTNHTPNRPSTSNYCSAVNIPLTDAPPHSALH